MKLKYSSYLKLDKLLNLQEIQSDPPEHDELLFIIIHQIHELWFKVLLQDLEKIRGDLSADQFYGAIASFKRARTVMKTLVGQLDILETMTPMSFSAFRERLETASGFQSVQFRELEFLLGQKRPETMSHFEKGSAGRKTLERRLREPSIVDGFHDFLRVRGMPLPLALRERDRTLPTAPNTEVQEQIFNIYKNQPETAILLELMIDFDEGLQEWRYRHVKLTERTIGNRRGTGGSTGIEYLKETLFRPIFPDLWAIRHRF